MISWFLVVPALLWFRCLSPFFFLLSFLRTIVLFHHDSVGSSWFRLGFRCLSPFFSLLSLLLFSGKGFCSIMICWLLLVPARVRVVVSLFISSFFFQETGLCSIMISWFLLVPVLAPVLVSLLSFVRKRVLFHGFSLSGSGSGAYVPSSPFFSFSQENGFVPPRLHGSVSTQASCVPFSISSLTNEFRNEQ